MINTEIASKKELPKEFKLAVWGLSKIFDTSEFELKIPAYQRDYAWPEDFVWQFLEDICAAVQDERLYRLGCITLFEAPKEQNPEKKKFEIIDGQQRLVTLRLIAHNVLVKDEKKLPFSDQTFYPASQKRIYENNKIVKRYLEGKDDLKKKLKDEFLESKFLEFSVFEAKGDLSEAFQYFNSLNSRGKDLIGIDVLKAYHYGVMERAAKDFKKEIDSLLGNYSRENSEIDRNCVVLHLTIDIQRNIQNKALELFGSSLLIEDILKGIQLIDNYDYKNNKLSFNSDYLVRSLIHKEEKLLRVWEKNEKTNNNGFVEEGIETIQRLFDDYLCPILDWQSGNRSQVLSKQNLVKFHGLASKKLFKNSYGCYKREKFGSQIFLLGHPFVSGFNFFEYINHYLKLMEHAEREARKFCRNEKGEISNIFGEVNRDIISGEENSLDNEFNVWRKSYRTNLLFKQIIFCFIDRFEPINSNGELIDNWGPSSFSRSKFEDVLNDLALWSFFPRCYAQRLTRQFIEKYVNAEFDLGECNDFKKPLFVEISRSFDPDEIRRRLFILRKVDGSQIEKFRNKDETPSAKQKFESLIKRIYRGM